MKSYIVSLFGIVFIAGCGEAPRTIHADSSKAPVEIRSITVQTRDIPLLYLATGSVHARSESQLASQVMARVLSVNVHVGDSVRAGQLLVSLDTQEQDANYRKAEAIRAEAQSVIADSDSSVAEAKANLDLANVTAERMNDLFAKRSISTQEMDETSAKLKTAQASYQRALARREQLNHRIAQDDAALQEERTIRGFAQIRAPFAGTITVRNVEPGAMAIPGMPLLTIEAGSGFRLHTEVSESQISLVHRNDQVPVFIDSLQREINGRVVELSPVSDSNSHSYTVKIDLPADAALRSGEYGHASFIAGHKQALAIPAASLTESGQLQSVFVNDHGLARIRLVSGGQKQGGEVEILAGLQPGEHIVYPVPSGLADGDRVEDRP